MKAIILAAGQGTRLRPLTNEIPKCLVPIRGVPIIERTIKTLSECGIDSISVVAGYKAEKIAMKGVKKYLNPRFMDTNMVYSLFCAEAEFDDDLLVVYGDSVFSQLVISTLLAEKSACSITVDLDWYAQWSARFSDPLSDAETMAIDQDGYVIELGKKPKNLKQVQGQYMGLIRFSKDFLTDVAAIYRSLQPGDLINGRSQEQMHMTDFLQLLIDRYHNLKAVPVHGGWFEVDSLSDLRLADSISL